MRRSKERQIKSREWGKGSEKRVGKKEGSNEKLELTV